MVQDVSSFFDIVCHSSRNKNLLVHSNLSNDSWIGGIKSDVRTTCSDQTEITQPIQQSETQFSLTDRSEE